MVRIILVCLFQCLLVNLHSQELLEMKVLDSICVFFDTGSSYVKNKQKISTQLKAIEKPKYGRIVIRGYTDSLGSISANTVLAKKRITSVINCLNGSTIRTLPIDTFNFNESHKSILVNDSISRRVELIVYEITPTFSYNTPIDLKINFRPETDRILPNSTKSVDNLYLLMELDTSLSIKLNGHVCCSPEYELSLKRAKKVKAYLEKKGISPTRITCEGYSNDVPLAKETTEEGRAKNRRVEVIFVKP